MIDDAPNCPNCGQSLARDLVWHHGRIEVHEFVWDGLGGVFRVKESAKPYGGGQTESVHCRMCGHRFRGIPMDVGPPYNGELEFPKEFIT